MEKIGVHAKEEPPDDLGQEQEPVRRSPRQPKPTIGKGKYANCLVGLKQPFIVVRPAPVPKRERLTLAVGDSEHLLNRTLWLRIFSFLSSSDLVTCMKVCKTWNQWCCSRQLWMEISLRDQRLKNTHLMGLVRRQPASLDISWTNISKKQLSWLIARLPHLKSLHLDGCSWAAISALCAYTCPLLNKLSLEWVEGLHDACICELLAVPRESRPGFLDTKSKLRCIMDLRLTGCDIGNDTLAAITDYLPNLKKLDVSFCQRISNDGIEVLARSKLQYTVTSLNLSSCTMLSNKLFDALKLCRKLECVDLRDCPQITLRACQHFISCSGLLLTVTDEKLMIRS